jgi:tetratricopeptide (TPR) repeat protein
MAPDYGRRPAVVLDLAHGAWIYLAWLLPAALAVWAWRNRASRPWVLAAMLIFVAGVAPVLGFTPFMFQYMSTVADHYLYLAMLGPALLLTWALVRYRQRAFAAACAVALLALAARSNAQLAIWHDDKALWAHTMQACPDSFTAPTNLAADLGREGQILGAAATDARERGDTAQAAHLTAAARHNYERAVELLQRAVAINPQYITARHNAFVNCLRIGQHRRAAEHVEAMLAANDASPPAVRCNFNTYHDAAGHLWMKAGEYDRAAAHFQKLLTLVPEHATARQSLNEARTKLAEAQLDQRAEP